ncbi:MAG: tetratricopeptide repeat protein [Planctomycetes bacterium]|nr:tetratricopeptide repeat protein [Planctomycetota bacterium]
MQMLGTMALLACVLASCQLAAAAESQEARTEEQMKEFGFSKAMAKCHLMNGFFAHDAGKEAECYQCMTKAIAAYEKALKIVPDDLVSLDGLALATIYAKDFEKAAAYYTKVLERVKEGEERSPRLCNRAIAYMEMGKCEEAMKDLDGALKANPDSKERVEYLKAVCEKRMKSK